MFEQDMITASYSLNIDDDDVNEKHADLLSVIYMALEVGRLGAVSYLMREFRDLDENQISESTLIHRIHTNGLMSEVDVENGWVSMGGMAHETFITMNKDSSAKVIIPVQKDAGVWFSVSKSFSRSDLFYNYSTPADEMAKQICNRLEKMFGKDFWDIDKGVDIRIPMNRKLFNGLTLEGIDEEIDNVYEMIDWIKAIHIISPKAGSQQTARKIRNLKQAASEGEDVEVFKNNVVNLRKFNIAIEIDMEPAHVQYVTQVKNPSPAELGIYLTSKIRGVCQDKYEPDCFMSPAAIAQKTAKQQKVNRLNELQLTINSSGSPMYIPRVDESKNFIDQLMKSGDKSPIGWTLSSMFSNTDGKNAINNKVVFTDEVNSMLSYIDGGEVVSIDLSDCVPFQAQHAMQFANSSIARTSAAIHSLNSFNYYLSRNADIVEKVKINPNDFAALYHPVSGQRVAELGNVYVQPDDSRFESEIRNLLGQGIVSYINEVSRVVRRIQMTYRYESDRNSDFELPESHDWVDRYDVMDYNLGMLTPDTPIQFLRPLAQLIQELAKVIIKEPVANVESRSISMGTVGVGFAFYAAKYLNRMPEVEKQAQAYFDTLKLKKPVTTWKAPALAGVNANFKLLPHQGGVHQKMESNPRYMILAVDAGGGKTLLAATKCIKIIQEGRFKKPLINCPNYLISNYVQDLITLTDGRWNIIPITRSTIASHGKAKVFAMVKNAPPNTLFITDYNYVKGSVVEVPYGTSVMTISENSNFLRDMGFDCAFLDESHTVKNPDSKTTIAALKLISSMQMICLMSGTVIHGGAQDLYAQVMLLDPTVFGSWEDFKREYAAEWKGNKITLWKQGAEKKMMERIRSRIAYIQVKKKEWSSLLPKRIERFHGVKLNDSQSKVYNAVLESVLEDIYNDKDMKKRLEEASADQEDFELEAKLNTYLARIEKFLAAPGTDPLADVLSPEDMISPKVNKIAEIIEDHWKRKIPGKILIFTSFVPSAEEIFKYLPSHIRKKTLLYKASSKAKDKSIFMNDDNIQVMIGVEQSLNTGHNFQNTSRIIRVESVWNPGTLEQAESRIFRPDVKNTYGINEKYLDWVLCEGTIDVTKAARLMSKILWNVAIEEMDNPLYAHLPQVELVRMTLDNIASENDWVSSLAGHIDAYKEFRDAQNKDFEEYLKRDDILTKPFAVPAAPMMSGSAIIEGVPYIENHALPFQDKLGLRTLTQYASDMNEGPDTLDASGLWVHTEFGDGIVTRNAKGTVWVKLKSGQVVKGVAKEKIFVFEDQTAASKDKKSVKQRLRELLDLPIIQVTKDQVRDAQKFINEHEVLDDDLKAEIDDEGEEPEVITKKPEKKEKEELVLPKKVKEKEKPKKPNPNTDFEENGSISLFASSINGQIAIAIDDDDPDTPDTSVLEKEGFQFSGKYAYARIPSRIAMNNLVAFVENNIEKGNININDKLLEEMYEIQQAWSQSKTKAKTIDVLSMQELRTYYLMRIRRPKNPKTVILTFVVEDGEMYAIVDLEKTARGRAFIKRKIKGIDWDTSDGEYMKFFRKKSEAKAFIKELRQKYQINNLEDVKDEIREIIILKRNN